MAAVDKMLCRAPTIEKDVPGVNETLKYYQFKSKRKDFTGASLLRVFNTVFSTSATSPTNKTTILFLGDSIMLQHHAHIRELPAVDTIYISHIYPLLYPFEEVINTPCIKRHFNYTYMNFGALHMLHLYPVRPWELPAIIELYYLEDLMHLEIGKYWSISDHIIIQTPPYVCERFFRSSYSDWFQNETIEIVKCALYIQNVSSLVMGGGVQPAPSTGHQSWGILATMKQLLTFA